MRFWSIRGLMTEGRRWLTGALEVSEGVQPSVLGQAYYALGFAALGQGDYPQAKPLFERSLELGREAGDLRLEAQALQQIGFIVSTSGDYAEDHKTRRVSSPVVRSTSRARSATSWCSRAR